MIYNKLFYLTLALCAYSGITLAMVECKQAVATQAEHKAAIQNAETKLSAEEEQTLNTQLFALIDNKDATEEQLALLLARGADIEARNEDGDTPLMLAAIEGNELILDALLKHGANINCRETESSHPILMNALNHALLRIRSRDGKFQEKYVPIANKLIDAGIELDVNHVDTLVFLPREILTHNKVFQIFSKIVPKIDPADLNKKFAGWLQWSGLSLNYVEVLLNAGAHPSEQAIKEVTSLVSGIDPENDRLGRSLAKTLLLMAKHITENGYGSYELKGSFSHYKIHAKIAPDGTYSIVYTPAYGQMLEFKGKLTRAKPEEKKTSEQKSS